MTQYATYANAERAVIAAGYTPIGFGPIRYTRPDGAYACIDMDCSVRYYVPASRNIRGCK